MNIPASLMIIHLGSIHFDLDQEPEAVEWLKRATATDPDNLYLRLSIGEAYPPLRHHQNCQCIIRIDG
jgi:predicted Zn-dependent protease